jgi:hypothetical protein
MFQDFFPALVITYSKFTQNRRSLSPPISNSNNNPKPSQRFLPTLRAVAFKNLISVSRFQSVNKQSHQLFFFNHTLG